MRTSACRDTFAWGLALCVTAVLLPAPGAAQAARYWPLSCQGPMPEVRFEAGAIRFEARAGRRPAEPAQGECVWMDRGMDRPGESQGGVARVEVPLPRAVPMVETRGGRTRVRFGHALADRIWTAATQGGRFTVRVQRRGTGRYVASTAPVAVAAPSRRSGGGPAVSAAPAGTPRQGTGPAGGAAPTRSGRPVTVRVRVDRIDVHADGDRVSPGDWILALAVQRSRGPTGEAVREVQRGRNAVRGPRSGTINVDSDKTYEPGLESYVQNVGPDDWLVIGIVAVDCDRNGPFNLLDYRNLLPFGALVNLMSNALGGSCGGEEINELSGRPDVAARTVRLAPREWRNGRRFAYRITASGVDFTAYGRIQVIR